MSDSSSIPTSAAADAPRSGHPSEPPADSAPERGRRVLAGSSRLAPWVLPLFLLLIVAVFSILRPETYFTWGNLETIAVTQSVLVILALAAMVPLVAGSFDLSIGANLALGGVLATGLAAKSGLSTDLAILVAMATCTLVGLANGLLVTRIRIDPFIATLGMGSVLGGIVLWYTEGQVIFQVGDNLKSLGQADLLGIPVPIWIMAVIALLVWYLLEHTPIGRYVYALGGSSDAARLSGLHVHRLTLLAFVISGLLAGFAGVVQAGALSAGNPTIGPGFLLPAFAAAFLGATAIKLGSFNVWGTVVAVYLLAAGVTGLVQMGAPSYVEPVFNGIALIVGVGLVRFLRKE